MEPGKFTFDDLRNLVDVCASSLQDCEKLFQVQVKESNALLIKNTKIVEALKTLRERLEFLFLLHQAFSDAIEQVKYNLHYAEEMVDALEKNLVQIKGERCKRTAVSDTYRQNTYCLAESISVTLSNIDQGLEQIGEQLSLKSQLNSDVEILAQILQKHLEHLEQIEVKIYHLADGLNETANLKNACFRLYQLAQ
ncbi:uncharacterized protein LOC143200345 isoform X1 [Rhynchophorus ferrugineus]|uniref:uncharacterized protein LOC143200345 isoform X1 n=1 Tax=Rhynchophorus ferrugineus TaxID=354439 RepID=UPI003FCE3459